MDERLKNWVIISVTAALAVATYYLLPSDLNELARRTATIFIVAAVFWATEVLPLYATSLCVLGLQIIFLADAGGLADSLSPISGWPADDAGQRLSLSYKSFLTSFASPVIILFMGGFLLSAAVTKHGLDRVIAGKLLRPFTNSPMRLVFAVAFITAFFSMWMSNTATTAMMIAIIAPLIKQFPSEDRFHRCIILAVPFGANIGGIGTPIGTPPNAVALAALRKAGTYVGFLDWMILAVPLAIGMLIVAIVLLYLTFPPQKGMKLPTIEAAGKISSSGRMTLGILLLTIGLWLTSQWTGLSDAAVALLAAAALTALQVLDRHDVDSIDWNVLILMWGGLSLGTTMQTSGLIDYIVSLPLFTQIQNLPPTVSGLVFAIAVVLLSLVLSTFMSNTAAAALIVPMAMGFSPDQATQMAILTALACSFAMAMPVSTPPNAIAFATGQIPVSSMMRVGGLVSVISVISLLLFYQFIFPFIFAG